MTVADSVTNNYDENDLGQFNNDFPSMKHAPSINESEVHMADMKDS